MSYGIDRVAANPRREYTWRVISEVIGAGCLADGDRSSDKSDFPMPIRPNAPIGQHLRVERLVRVLPDRMLYLANNQSPLWSHRKCWACGHLYSPNRAQSCTLCGTPLRDRRFLVSVHLDPKKYTGFEGFHQNDMGQLRILQPILMTYRERRLVAVYPYNGERLLADEPAALGSDYLMILVHRLAGLLNSFHARGAVLSEFTAANIVKLPDGSPAWFDMDIARVVGSRDALHAMDSKPIARDLANLCAIASRFCNPSNEGLKRFLIRVPLERYITNLQSCWTRWNRCWINIQTSRIPIGSPCLQIPVWFVR